MKNSHRITAGLAGAAAAVGIIAAAGTASAGTLPVTRPGEPTVAMTITNHTGETEYLVGSTAGGTGRWINAPAHRLAPGASETITANAPFANYLTANAQYRIGLRGPVANYEVQNMQGNVNTAMTGVSGTKAAQFWINSTISSRFPNVNVGFDQW